MNDKPNDSTDVDAANARLEEFRQKIDAIDRRLIDAINERAELVVDIGKLKRDAGIPIYAPHREAAVLEKIRGLNKGPIHNRTIEAVYRELMSGSFALEQPLRCLLYTSDAADE